MNRNHWYAVTLAALGAVPLVAQDPGQGAPPKPVERERVTVLGPEGRRIYEVFTSRRGRLGVTVSMQLQASDSLGTLVDAVSPGGPAFKAGIRSGDLITALNSQALVARVPRGTRQPPPGITLVEMLAKHVAGDTVRVTYRRGNDRKTVSVILEEMPEMGLAPFANGTWQMETEGPDLMYTPRALFDDTEPLRVGPGDSFLLFRSRMVDLELAPMNQDLGQYFGVSDGVLVISAPGNSRLNLHGGDVILAVDGRRVVGPANFFRILSSYENGESFRVDIMRQKRRETVTAKMGN